MAQVYYYNDRVKKEIFALPKKTLAKYAAIVGRLIQFGTAAQTMPHIRYLRSGIWEIRAISSDGSVRIFYFWSNGETIVILHSFLKKQQKTPAPELDLALKRMEEVQKCTNR